jgi:hypothetical protein
MAGAPSEGPGVSQRWFGRSPYAAEFNIAILKSYGKISNCWANYGRRGCWLGC